MRFLLGHLGARSGMMAKSRAGAKMWEGNLPPPAPPKYFHQGAKGSVRVYLEEAGFLYWQVNPWKGISESAAFALAELGSRFAGSSRAVSWPFGTGGSHRRCRAVSKSSSPRRFAGFPPPESSSAGGHPSAPRGCFAAASCAGGEVVGCFCPGSSRRRAPR